MVETVSGYGQKALGLTDHGNMAGSVELYKECSDAGIKPFPGTELYVVKSREDKRAKRHHMCAVAYTTQGYENMVNLNTMMNRNFYYKPIVDFGDLAQLSEDGLLDGIAATSGCFFGFVSQAITNGNYDEARAILKCYDKWFGKFYVELQNHNIQHDDNTNDDMLADELRVLARELGLPCVLTQDSHYCHQEDKPVHETLKRLVAFGDDVDVVGGAVGQFRVVVIKERLVPAPFKNSLVAGGPRKVHVRTDVDVFRVKKMEPRFSVVGEVHTGVAEPPVRVID
jgi:DNA polymerase-3 subunit alpha